MKKRGQPLKAHSPAPRAKAPRAAAAKSAPAKPATSAAKHAPAASSSLPADIAHALRRVIARQTRVSLGECASLLLAVLPAAWLVQAVADRWFDLPWPVRLILLAGDLAAAAFIICRFAIRPWRNSHTLDTAALAVERQVPEFHSALISAVQLSSGHVPFAKASRPLVAELIRRVSLRISVTDLAARVVETRRLRRWMKWALVSVLISAAAAALYWPRTITLVERILLGRQPLPTRTIVVPITRDQTVPLGADVTLSARAQGVVPRSGLVVVTFANQDRQEIAVSPSPDDPAVFSLTMQNIQQSFTYQFRLNDGVGPAFAVTARQAPMLASIHIRQAYPAYTGLPAAEMPPGNLSLLAGSQVRIAARSTQPLASASLQLEGLNRQIPLAVNQTDRRSASGEFTVPTEGLTGLSVPLVNADGVASRENTIYRVELLQDQPPVLELTEPSADRLTILQKSRPRLVFSVKDDFGLGKLTLKYELTRPTPAGGEEPAVEKGEISLPLPPNGSGLVSYAWAISEISPPAPPGSTLTYWIEAQDNNNVTGPGIGATPRKSFSIVTPEEKNAELLDVLGARASDIERIYDSQKKVNEDLETSLKGSSSP